MKLRRLVQNVWAGYGNGEDLREIDAGQGLFAVEDGADHGDRFLVERRVTQMVEEEREAVGCVEREMAAGEEVA